MANHPSALKRERQSRDRRQRNASSKSRIKTAVKKMEQTLAGSGAEAARPLLVQAVKLIDKASAKGTLHPRNAARKIARLSRKCNNAPAAPSA